MSYRCFPSTCAHDELYDRAKSAETELAAIRAHFEEVVRKRDELAARNAELERVSELSRITMLETALSARIDCLRDSLEPESVERYLRGLRWQNEGRDSGLSPRAAAEGNIRGFASFVLRGDEAVREGQERDARRCTPESRTDARVAPEMILRDAGEPREKGAARRPRPRTKISEEDAKRLREAAEAIWPFVEEDFPDGTNPCSTPAYRHAYELLRDALAQSSSAPTKPRQGIGTKPEEASQ
jgi:hypothetical protein